MVASKLEVTFCNLNVGLVTCIRFSSLRKPHMSGSLDLFRCTDATNFWPTPILISLICYTFKMESHLIHYDPINFSQFTILGNLTGSFFSVMNGRRFMHGHSDTVMNFNSISEYTFPNFILFATVLIVEAFTMFFRTDRQCTFAFNSTLGFQVVETPESAQQFSSCHDTCLEDINCFCSCGSRWLHIQLNKFASACEDYVLTMSFTLC